ENSFHFAGFGVVHLPCRCSPAASVRIGAKVAAASPATMRILLGPTVRAPLVELPDLRRSDGNIGGLLSDGTNFGGSLRAGWGGADAAVARELESRSNAGASSAQAGPRAPFSDYRKMVRAARKRVKRRECPGASHASFRNSRTNQ